MVSREEKTDKYLSRLAYGGLLVILIWALRGLDGVWNPQLDSGLPLRVWGMGGIQILTLCAAKLFFDRYYEKSRDVRCKMTGPILYMTCPYRIYICYQKGDLRESIAWICLPLLAWAVLQVAGHGNKGREPERGERLFLGLGIISLTGIGYLHLPTFLAAMGGVLLAALYVRSRKLLWFPVGSSLLGIPAIGRCMAPWLAGAVAGGAAENAMAVESLMASGYRLGQIFASYDFREGHPGLGLGIMLGLGATLWAGDKARLEGNAEAIKNEKRKHAFVLILGGIFLMASWNCFPWDVAGRLGPRAMEWMGLLVSPVTLFGMASACLSVAAGNGMEGLGDKLPKEVYRGIWLLTILLSLWICMIQCGILA